MAGNQNHNVCFKQFNSWGLSKELVFQDSFSHRSACNFFLMPPLSLAIDCSYCAAFVFYSLTREKEKRPLEYLWILDGLLVPQAHRPQQLVNSFRIRDLSPFCAFAPRAVNVSPVTSWQTKHFGESRQQMLLRSVLRHFITFFSWWQWKDRGQGWEKSLHSLQMNCVF